MFYPNKKTVREPASKISGGTCGQKKGEQDVRGQKEEKWAQKREGQLGPHPLLKELTGSNNGTEN